MSAIKNDGSVAYGSKVLTIGSASGGTGGTTYVADNIELTRPTTAILRTNEIGEPSGRVAYKNDVDTFTATLQLASTSTVPPSLGWETTVTFDSTTGAEVFYVTALGTSFTKDGETKVNATFAKKIS